MPVTALNAPLDINAWDNFARKTQLPVIIDAAGAFGNQQASEFCTLVFSLHATKSLGAGEGGFIISPHEKWIQDIRYASNFGFDLSNKPALIHVAGNNAKLSEYHAAVALCSLENWPLQREKRQQRSRWYQHYLQNDSRIIFQQDSLNAIQSIFSLRLPNININTLMTYFTNHNIETKRWYFPPLHQHPAFSHYPKQNELPCTTLLSQELIGLPFHCFLTEDDIALITKILFQFLEKSV
jgi:dTDP-4-amino-4,6-dideoxygalactose transaminase